MSRIPEYDDGYDSKESFERAGCDTDEDLDEKCVHNGECPNCGADIPEAEMDKPCWDCGSEPGGEGDPNEWVICPACRGDGHHAKHLGAFTQSEFNECFDDEDSREGYFAGRYDRTCGACGGTGKLRRRDLHLADEEDDRHNRNNSRFNDAGEPLC